MAAGKKRKLGRGLSGMMGSIAPADLGDAAHVREAKPVVGVGVDGVTVEEGIEAARHPGIEGEARGVTEIEVGRISASPYQPRRSFDEAELAGLAASIRQSGMIQPVLVRPRGDGFELVAGERRWRAAQRAGLKSIRAVVTDVAEKDVLTLALVENLQRQDLNPIEEAEAYQRLHEQFGHSQADIARAVGKDRTTVTNALRLLKLPDGVRQLVLSRELSMGHARALLSLEDAKQIERAAREAMSKGWSVRETERAVAQKKASREASSANGAEAAADRPQETAAERELKDRLTRGLGTRVEIKHKGGRGTLVVHFNDFDHLDDVLSRMNV